MIINNIFNNNEKKDKESVATDSVDTTCNLQLLLLLL